MSATSLYYKQDQWGKVQPRLLRLQYNITAAKTVSPIVANSASLTAFDAIATQAVIDTFLGTTNEFLLAAFDATAMGVDAFAAIVDMQGQCQRVVFVKTQVYSTTGGATVTTRAVAPAATLTASSLTTEATLGSTGNIALRSIITGIDILTAGIIDIDIHWISK